ncbi:MAG: hypothetical protein A2945_00660 [Candidatus Liptonbacteria bacterium RIFCSPLOWO2_01_FULL_52_25]|uniref:Uncharacterized protein n=1 Tax=Candidatus Liptonbacteria bacterium RIFCSPLOWO2_01_FULL_52_25 TaxID=1798650 RepID=A0A1G2CFM1_9BACT|nr:MAG: hypothetical protein A2945_00660 [Candidatus Liptonbacteria bacterium RIFCSPLOWO2_01_FULL_52_25]
MSGVTIQKSKIRAEKGMVVLPIEEYKKLLLRAVPTFYLSGKAAERIDRLVKDGFTDLKRGKVKRIKSLADLD